MKENVLIWCGEKASLFISNSNFKDTRKGLDAARYVARKLKKITLLTQNATISQIHLLMILI